jgi:uroporphyrinogen III methyltransferase / synthase
LKKANVVLARSKEGNDDLRQRLEGIGFPLVSVETIEHLPPDDWSPVDSALEGLRSYDWVGLTSPRAADLFAERLHSLGMKPRGMRPRFAAVGGTTAARLRSHGFEVSFVPEEYLVSELGAGLPAEFGRRVLLLRADIADKKLVAALSKRGFEVTDIALYRTRSAPGEGGMRSLGRGDVVVFASPSEVRGFTKKAEAAAVLPALARATALCIGPVTAEAARVAGFRRVVTSRVHTVSALAHEVERFLADA